jgi:hypothetical protein
MVIHIQKVYKYFLEHNAEISLDEINEYLKNIGDNPIKQRTYEHFQELFKYGYNSHVPAAQFVDSLKGYEFFLRNRGKVSLDDLNIYLKSINGRLIHQRTYKHYEKLLRRGFSSYVPINQFDVSRTLGKLQFASDRREYSRKVSHLTAKISKDGEIWILVIIRDKSLVGFGIETINEVQLEPNNPLIVRIENYRDIPVIMVWKHYENGLLRIGVRALQFIQTYKISKAEILISRPTGLLTVKKISGTFLSWKELYRILEKINELIGGSSELLNEVAKIIEIKEFKIIQPDVSSISFDSPFDIKINIDVNVAKILNVIFKWCFLGKARKERYKETTKAIKEENKKELLEFEQRRNAINPKKESDEPDIPQDVSDSLRKELEGVYKIKQLPSDLLAPGSYENGILRNQVFPPAEELIAGDDPEIEVAVKKRSTDNLEKK